MRRQSMDIINRYKAEKHPVKSDGQIDEHSEADANKPIYETSFRERKFSF